ncbi:MAG TPA: VCBS repeat-containing protein [Pyrinomonadaceae bacterium]
MHKRVVHFFAFSIAIFAIGCAGISAQGVVRQASGADPASIQAAVDQFRADLGPLNTNTRQTFSTGRREINWDGVPEGASAPNSLSPDFFNFNSPRGVMFTSTAGPDLRGVIAQPFLVSSSAASGVPVRFGNLNPTYTNEFQAFSEQKIFAPTPGSNVIEITFFIPGTNIPATVSGFGAVFCDADTPATHMQFYDQNGRILLQPSDPVVSPDKGLAFQGVSFNDGTRIARVVMVLGNTPLSLTNTDGVNGVDVVAVDDFIYGEPHALEHHSADFDGDGSPDLSVFRPSSGQWFILNSGSNTVRITQFGLNGDVPVDADFDGDRRSDIAVFRPSTGTWFSLKSSNGQFSAIHFGLAGDKPVPGDYDKDGRTDIAVWRPSIGDYFILKSSTGQASETHWGLNGDIPIGAAK